MIKAILLITLILDEIYIFVIKQDHYWSDEYLPLLMRHLISPLLLHSAHSLGIVISKFKRLFYCLWSLDFFLKKICVKYQLPDRRVFIVCQLNQSRKMSTGPELSLIRVELGLLCVSCEATLNWFTREDPQQVNAKRSQQLQCFITSLNQCVRYQLVYAVQSYRVWLPKGCFSRW